MSTTKERTIEMRIVVPLSTYRLVQSAAETQQLTPAQIAAYQLVKYNEPPLRERRMLETRENVYTLWMEGLSTPKIARELGCSTGTVDKHKRAIRDDWASWASKGQAST